MLLGKIPPIDGKMSYVYDKHVFHYLVEGNVTYLCMADEGMKRRIPFTFLEDIKRRFVTQYGEAAHNAIAFAFNNEFSPVLQARARARARARSPRLAPLVTRAALRRVPPSREQTQMEFYNNDPNADGLNKVKVQLDDVKNVMVENIEKVLERGEKIELLVDKTDRLNQQAFKFEKTSKQLRDQMFWRKVKTYLMIAFAVALTIFIITLAACGGFRFKKCRNPDETSE